MAEIPIETAATAVPGVFRQAINNLGSTIANLGTGVRDYGAQAVNAIVENPVAAAGYAAGAAGVGALAYAYNQFRNGNKEAARDILESNIQAIADDTVRELNEVSASLSGVSDEGSAMDRSAFLASSQKAQESIFEAKALAAVVGDPSATLEDLERAIAKMRQAEHDANVMAQSASASAANVLLHPKKHRRHAPRGRHVVEEEEPRKRGISSKAASSSSRRAEPSTKTPSGRSRAPRGGTSDRSLSAGSSRASRRRVPKSGRSTGSGGSRKTTAGGRSSSRTASGRSGYQKLAPATRR